MVARFVRKVRTASGAVAVQVVTRAGRRVVGVEHACSVHDNATLELLMAVALQQLRPGQGELDLDDLDRVPQRVEDVADWTASLVEVARLARTLTRRRADVLAYFERPRTSNGPTEAINGRLEHLRGTALGFRNLTHYIARTLLHAGGFRPRLHPQLG